MHLSLSSIKIEKFRLAESHLETLKILLEFKEGQEAFVKATNFLTEGMSGKQIQMETYIGRYLSYSCLAQETKGFKEQYFKGLVKQTPSGIARMIDTVADQINKLHTSVQEVMAKLLKNKDCKDRVMRWFRLAVGMNQEKQKMYTQIPVSSDGFILNLIDVLLMFCKPFTTKFTDFHQNFQKVNCFYLMDDTYVFNGVKIEKIDNDLVNLFRSNASDGIKFTGVTIEPTQQSSLESDEVSTGIKWEIAQPNFITECFFLTHILINLIAKKYEQMYEQLAKAINDAAHKKDFQTFEELMGTKMCIDVHLTGKNTLAGFRYFLTFTGALFMCMNNGTEFLSKKTQLGEIFQNIDTFQSKLVSTNQYDDPFMPVDIAVLPTLILQNLGGLPRLFRKMNPEAYYGKDVDLNIQVATNTTIILNKRVKNPHIRAEMVKFIAYLVPQSFMNKSRKSNPRQDRDDNMYKDIFFQNITMREYLIEALVNVYIDSERTGYYEKATFRFYSSLVMEYVWSDGQYREKFMQLGTTRPGLFIEFCNFLINDLNTLLFDGLLEIEEIRDFEELSNSADWSQLDQE